MMLRWLLWRQPPTVTLYTRAACPLCDDARAELERLARRWRFQLYEVDIMSNWETYEQYHEKIPVIAVGETVVGIGGVDPGRLSEALQAAARRPDRPRAT